MEDNGITIKICLKNGVLQMTHFPVSRDFQQADYCLGAKTQVCPLAVELSPWSSTKTCKVSVFRQLCRSPPGQLSERIWIHIEKMTTSILGCIELGGKIEKFHFTYWLTLFSLYFLILRLIYFPTFFYLRPPSFANLNFCLLMGIRRNFNGKIIRFWISRRNMV